MRRSRQCPALTAWRDELRRGLRTSTTYDPLWRSACAEMTALEFEQDRLPEIADRHRADAKEIVRQAIQEAS